VEEKSALKGKLGKHAFRASKLINGKNTTNKRTSPERSFFGEQDEKKKMGGLKKKKLKRKKKARKSGKGRGLRGRRRLTKEGTEWKRGANAVRKNKNGVVTKRGRSGKKGGEIC